MTLSPYIALSAIVFCLGLYGVLTKRNAVIVLFSVELMLNAVNINLVAFAKYGPAANIVGHVFTLFTITIAAAEAAVGIALLIALYRSRGSVLIDKFNVLKR